jgi:hypothetical protein
MPAGIRPRSLSWMPWSRAQARMSRLRRRLAAVRTGRRGWPLARRACSTNGASCLRSFAAFFSLRSISYSEPPTPNRTVSSAGPPSRSSSSATIVLRAIPTPGACADLPCHNTTNDLATRQRYARACQGDIQLGPKPIPCRGQHVPGTHPMTGHRQMIPGLGALAPDVAGSAGGAGSHSRRCALAAAPTVYPFHEPLSGRGVRVIEFQLDPALGVATYLQGVPRTGARATGRGATGPGARSCCVRCAVRIS